MSDEIRKLPKEAYGGIKGDDYKPFIDSNEKVPESTVFSVILGIISAVIFAAANTYLGLKVGLTISAGIPGAILATGLFRSIFKRSNILESNYVASLAAVGESIAGGIIFVLPALILIGFNLPIWTVVVVTVIGGLMGVYFIIPVRKHLIVQEHGKLVYPEAMAQAEVIVNANQGGKGFAAVLKGLIYGFVYKILSGGFALWNETSTYVIKRFQNTMIGTDTLASLVGVGFIIGTKTSVLMLAGSIVAWLGFIPLIKFFGGLAETPIFPSTMLISEMSAADIWSNYIKYIGAGAVAMGGFISLARSLPTIINSFKQAMGGLGKGDNTLNRVNQDPSIIWVFIAAIAGFFLIWLTPSVNAGPVGAILAVFFSFFFAVVSARMVGVIGASNNPVSGMTIATLLVIASVYKAMGATGVDGMYVVLVTAGVVCVAIAVGGGVAQSLKATFVLGGTPKKVQHGMFASLAVASFIAGATVLLLHSAYGIGTKQVTAPQATLMKLIVEGIMTGQLPWTLVIIGIMTAIFCALAGLPILPVALGIYLPISLNTAIFFGGLIRKFVDNKFKNDQAKLDTAVERGTLIASGLVAGDALTGIVIGIFAALNLKIDFLAAVIPNENVKNFISLAIFILLGFWLYNFSCRVGKEVKNA